MVIVCSKTDLLNGLNIVSKAVPSKTSMSILECILIDAREDIITLTGNDTEIGIKTEIDGTIEERGIIALDAKIFMDMIRRLSGDEVTIASSESLKTTITCENARFNIIGRDGNEYSFLPSYEKTNRMEISQFALKEGIRQTVFSISEGDSNKLKSGELFEIREDNLRLISLDGYRISIRNIKLKNFYDSNKIVIPGKSLNEIMKIIPGDPEKPVSIYTNSNFVIFEFERTVVVSRLIEGEFFPVDQFLSNDYETRVKINRRALMECVDRSTLLVNESDKKPLIIDISDDSMELRINTPQGSLKENIDIKKTGNDIMIGFNPKFMIDILKVIDDEEIDMYMSNPKAPCFMRDGDENYTYNYMILPVNFTTVS